MTKSVDVWRGCRGDHCADHIIHVDVIAGLCCRHRVRPVSRRAEPVSGNAAQRADVMAAGVDLVRRR